MADDDEQKRRLVEEAERDKKLRQELEEVEKNAQGTTKYCSRHLVGNLYFGQT